MKKYLFLALGLVAFACSKTEEVIPDLVVSSALAANSNIYFASTTLSGGNEVPAVVSSATGDASGNYNKTTKILSLNVTYAGITPTAWHIHKAAAGATGGVIFNLGTDFKTPFAYSTAALTDAQETDLLSGLNYLNLHSAKSPSGEIRGQLALANSKATGSVTGKFNPTTKVLTMTVSYKDMTPTSWHIHKGAEGVAGPVVFDLGTSFTSPYVYTSMPLSLDQEADFKAGLYYVNIHSKIAPSGEIRGQLSAK